MLRHELNARLHYWLTEVKARKTSEEVGAALGKLEGISAEWLAQRGRHVRMLSLALKLLASIYKTDAHGPIVVQLFSHCGDHRCEAAHGAQSVVSQVVVTLGRGHSCLVETSLRAAFLARLHPQGQRLKRLVFSGRGSERSEALLDQLASET